MEASSQYPASSNFFSCWSCFYRHTRTVLVRRLFGGWCRVYTQLRICYIGHFARAWRWSQFDIAASWMMTFLTAVHDYDWFYALHGDMNWTWIYMMWMFNGFPPLILFRTIKDEFMYSVFGKIKWISRKLFEFYLLAVISSIIP